MFFFFDNVQIELGVSPKEADVAIASIDSGGSIGELNQMVLKEYGYDKSILNQLNLEKGFDLFQLNGKAILFVVTVGIGNPINNLNENLKQAIRFHIQPLSNKKIWIPLMATGAGNLSYTESYKITIKILEELKNNIFNSNCQFLISIPNDEKGKLLYKQIEDEGINSETSISGSNKLNLDKPKNFIKNNNLKEINKVLQVLKANYYFARIDWEGKNQIQRFYKEGIWEKGFNDRLSSIINKIQVDDILIIKEPLKLKNEEYFKIIAIGKVTSNPKDGKKVLVNWLIKDILLEIKSLGYNNYTITTADLDSVKEIFSKISVEDLKTLKSSLPLGKRKKYEIIEDSEVEKKSNNTTSDQEIKPYTTTLPCILRDSETGEDHLDIKKDVAAFARVIAAKSFEPPLAIALLGKWGSGKSFFMNKLKENIQQLSKNNPQKVFCEGIAHVHFNAWSYMDANLWASIVTRIFEGLQEYISGDNKAKDFKKEIEKKLTQNLNIAKEEIAALEKQNKNISAQIDKLTIEKKEAEDILKDKIESIRLQTFKSIINEVDKEFKVTEQIETALESNETFINSTNRLKKIIPEQYWINPEELYIQIKSKYTFIKTFFYGENWWKNCLWLLGFLVIVLYTPIFSFIAALLLSWQDFTLTPKTWLIISLAGTTFARGVDTYKKIKTLIAPFWKIKVNYETEKENALFVFNQKEKALKLEIENSKNEINAISEQINKAILIKANIEFKIENALSTEALYSFIERRANSEDYKKHLGIVSVIRKDFEVLSDLLVDHKQESDKNEESIAFNEMFKNPLERIILYIDDLDRCPEERVVEVLEAVNLLMAFPLFVVVVGVDPRWVKTALKKKYENQFAKVNESEEAILPSNYLEKIFQVPFHLNDAGDISIKGMIKTLSEAQPNFNLNKIETAAQTEGETLLANDFTITADPGVNTIEIDSKLFINSVEKEKKTDLDTKETIEALNITEKECELLQDMSQIIGNNPRAVKRFINIYRIIKTHENFNYNKSTEEKELMAIMFLLALSMGDYKYLLKSFEYHLNQNVMSERPISDYFRKTYDDADYLIDDKAKILREKLKNLLSIKLIKLYKIEVDLFVIHYPFVKRFTFKNI
ncbi:P-loop NTPase fold protein [Flavobacterium sp. GSA192]|uniref:P-loop NTPase fold protein n=1 Tax=Flavobacterium sp. GSA192 TaxID=2576304 RepID=UPI00112D3533|nr:P-loop NTPase fold protein [Flavobacterium sp. GSA192]